jgi:hypothetical protein
MTDVRVMMSKKKYALPLQATGYIKILSTPAAAVITLTFLLNTTNKNGAGDRY